MRRIQFILQKNREVLGVLNTRGGRLPSRGDTFLVHRREGEDPVLWEVASVHGELWPGPHDIVLDDSKPLSVVDPAEYHEGDSTVVVMVPATGPAPSIEGT